MARRLNLAVTKLCVTKPHLDYPWRVTAHFIFAMHGRRIPKIGSHYDPFGPTKAEPVK